MENSTLKTFTVRWEIEIDATSAEEAARIAFDEYHRPGSDATQFEVRLHDSEDPMEPFELVDVAEEI